MQHTDVCLNNSKIFGVDSVDTNLCIDRYKMQTFQRSSLGELRLNKTGLKSKYIVNFCSMF